MNYLCHNNYKRCLTLRLVSKIVYLQKSYFFSKNHCYIFKRLNSKDCYIDLSYVNLINFLTLSKFNKYILMSSIYIFYTILF